MATRVRVVKRWDCYCPGDILEPAGVLRDQLLSMGLVERVLEPAPLETKPAEVESTALDAEPETVLLETPAPPVETADVKSARSRKR